MLDERGVTPLVRKLARDGKPMIGLSAGSLMLARDWVAFPDDDEAKAHLFSCIGVAPVHVDAHAEDDDWHELRVLLRLLHERGDPHPAGIGLTKKGALRVHVDGDSTTLDCARDPPPALRRTPREGGDGEAARSVGDFYSPEGGVGGAVVGDASVARRRVAGRRIVAPLARTVGVAAGSANRCLTAVAAGLAIRVATRAGCRTAVVLRAVDGLLARQPRIALIVGKIGIAPIPLLALVAPRTRDGEQPECERERPPNSCDLTTGEKQTISFRCSRGGSEAQEKRHDDSSVVLDEIGAPPCRRARRRVSVGRRHAAVPGEVRIRTLADG